MPVVRQTFKFLKLFKSLDYAKYTKIFKNCKISAGHHSRAAPQNICLHYIASSPVTTFLSPLMPLQTNWLIHHSVKGVTVPKSKKKNQVILHHLVKKG